MLREILESAIISAAKLQGMSLTAGADKLGNPYQRCGLSCRGNQRKFH
jgi:hypothetical protein